MTDRPQPHSLLAKIFHWGFIAIFVYAILKQVGGVNDLADTALLRFEVVFALGFLGLLAVRFVYMRMTRPSALPDATPRAIKVLARAGHLAMYISLASIAVSGLIIAAVYSTSGPDSWIMEPILELHGFAVTASYLAIALHVSAAVFHRLKGDGIWSAMVPIWTENKTELP